MLNEPMGPRKKSRDTVVKSRKDENGYVKNKDYAFVRFFAI